jgi:S1-C subfamily serine protease
LAYRALSAQDADQPLAPRELAAVKKAEALRVAAIESVYGAVVAIFGNDRGGGGSGVLYDPIGYALTNHHVVGAAGSGGWAGLADGKLYRWKLIGTDPGGDVAIIQLLGKKRFPTAPIGDSERIRVGDWAMAMGNPFVLAEDFRPTVTLGIVSGVHRFQEGSGLNQLVYGNCIQVDSSINPGNSGGPLFNLRGEVIGVNGRGSFEERGRVNVGLGYAISSNQIKLFIPELLSTKIAQHGTLDAVFGTRQEGVICHSVNLDAPIAKAGLELGDKLVAFEGFPIADANQFTNIISMYPAGWPAEVTWERNGAQHTAHVRLSSLPYEPIVRQPQERPERPPPRRPPGQPMPDEPPQPGRPRPLPDGAPPRRQAPKLPLPDSQRAEPPARLSLAEAGKIRDAELNRSIAEQIVARWQAGAGGRPPAPEGLRIEDHLLRGQELVGRQTISFAGDGRIRVDYELDGKSRSVIYDGKNYFLLTASGVQTISQARALRDPHFSQAAAVAALWAEKPLAAYGRLQLDGSDKGHGRLCYRLSASDPDSEQFFVWLSVFDDAGRPHVQLQKSGVGIDDDEPIPSVIYDQWQKLALGYLAHEAAGDVTWPRRRTLVLGLAERPALTCVKQSAAIQKLDETLFQLLPQP